VYEPENLICYSMFVQPTVRPRNIHTNTHTHTHCNISFHTFRIVSHKCCVANLRNRS